MYEDGSGSSDNGVEEYDGSDESLDEDNDKLDTGGDGMADMMAKILHQQVHGKVPVLAKRKTAIMKELETEYADRDRLKRLKVERQEERVKHMVVPDHTTLDYERQLRKVATRGVVALFNAIAKSRREEKAREDELHEKDKGTTKPKSKEVMELSRTNFLSMLKGDVAPVQSTGSNATGGDTTSGELKGKKRDNRVRDEDSDEDGKSSEPSWGAVRDNYMTDKKLALKDWDKESDQSGGDSDEADSDADRPSKSFSKLEDPFAVNTGRNRGDSDDDDDDDDRRAQKKKRGAIGKGNGSKGGGTKGLKKARKGAHKK